ncbi:LytR C-terminal domain-containing protein [Patescibacteria group bacterium]|nr:LytR C-terminal domain-containing protein [Patescibacteria group bacterium]
MSSWKNYQQKFKLRRVLRKAAIAVVAVMVIIIAAASIFLVQWWSGSVGVPHGSRQETPELSEEQQINFLVAGRAYDGTKLSGLAVAGLSQKEGILKILQIPVDTKIATLEGDYEVGTLLSVGSALNPPRPLDYLTESLENYLAVPLDGVIIVAAPDLGATPISGVAPILRLHQSAGSPLFWWWWVRNRMVWENQTQTNFSRSQFWGLAFDARKIRKDKIEFANLTDRKGYEEIEVRDKIVQSLFTDLSVEQEKLTARVFNGTAFPGLASQGARFLENLGIKVLVVDNFERTDVAQTQLISNQAVRGGWGVQRLKQIFRVSEVMEAAASSDRAEVDVVIGEDWNCQLQFDRE